MFLPARFLALDENSRTYLKRDELAPLPCEVRANIHKRGLLRIISDCAVNLVSAMFAFARPGEIDWTAADCMQWFSCDLADTTIISVPNGQKKILKLGFRGKAHSVVVHEKVAPVM